MNCLVEVGTRVNCFFFFLGMNPCVNLTHQNPFVKVKFVKILQKYFLILPFYFIG